VSAESFWPISIVNSTRCAKFSNLFYFGITLYMFRKGLSVHRQEFKTVHTHVVVCTVLNSWRWTERPSETCRVLFQNKISLRIWGNCLDLLYYVARPHERQIFLTLSSKITEIPPLGGFSNCSSFLECVILKLGCKRGDWGFYVPGQLVRPKKVWRQIQAVTVLVTMEAAARKIKYGTVTSTVVVGRGKLNHTEFRL
jgi:hypothetical protein